ncbi:class I SAM-dependent methyltransferase [Chlamydiota bacterium]
MKQKKFEIDAAKYYQNSKIASNYDSERFTSLSGKTFNFLEKRKLSKIIDKLDTINIVLDAPCGTGRITELLLKKGFTVTGGDISREMIDVAAKKLNQYRTKINFQNIDLTNTGVPDNYFDASFCIRLLPHLPSNKRIAILRELKRITNKYVIVTYSYSNLWLRLRRLFKVVLKQGFVKNALAKNELQNEINEAGLSIKHRFWSIPVISEEVILVLVSN